MNKLRKKSEIEKSIQALAEAKRVEMTHLFQSPKVRIKTFYRPNKSFANMYVLG